MLAIPGKNPLGNVLHLVIGPESELIMDMQGAVIMDVTQIINRFVTSEPVFVSLSRSRNEIMTSNSLKQAEVPHMGITGTPEKCDGKCNDCHVGPNGVPIPASAAKPKKIVKDEACRYCKKVTQLLPIPGFKICVACAQIELGLNMKGNINLMRDTPDANASQSNKP